MNIAAYTVAVVVFLFAAFGVEIGGASQLDLVCWGLAAFALGHVVP